MNADPYIPPTEVQRLGSSANDASLALNRPLETLAFAGCYSWLGVLLVAWLLDGLNVLIVDDIAYCLQLALLSGTIVSAGVYTRMRFSRSRYSTAAFLAILVILQLAAYTAISNHTVDRFPM